MTFMEKLADLKIVKKEYTSEYYEQEVVEETSNEYENVEIQDFDY